MLLLGLKQFTILIDEVGRNASLLHSPRSLCKKTKALQGRKPYKSYAAVFITKPVWSTCMN